MTADRIACRECGRLFRALGSHLRLAHGMDATAYRERWGIPASVALACEETRAVLSEQMRGMIADGTLTYDHLPAAMEAARMAGRGQRTPDDLAAQADRARRIPHATLSPGARRADGRDADRAREYQRAYRRKQR